MGRKKVKHETVNNFLNTLGYEWNYYIYDNVKDCYRRIAKTDFKKTTTLDCDVKRIQANNFINILLTVSDNKFIINGIGDYSQNWNEFLDNIENTKSL